MRQSLAILLLLAASSCQATAPGPVDAVAAYAAALRDGRHADAWRMLSASAREALPYDAFERAARERPEELRDAITAYERVDPQVPVAAQLELASGDRVRLLYEDGAWRIDPSALEFYGQHTPRQALQSFARAVEASRWDVLLRLAPRAVAEQLRAGGPGPDGGAPRGAEQLLRDAWTGEGAEGDRAMLRLLQADLDRGRPIEVAGDRATMTYGATQHVARLVREDGLWKVEDLD
ncbi:MAG: hypothetical protein U0324_13320 [Polyangiales bacterium]